jgi:hypothetical protein
MNCFCCLRRTAVALAALAVLGLAGPLSAARADPFEASGTAVQTARHGNVHSGTLSGDASPGNAFSGTFSQTATGDDLNGTATFVFGDGSTLTVAYNLELDREANLYQGTYAITDGTGVFEGAGGVGVLVTGVGGTVGFTLSGSIE